MTKILLISEHVPGITYGTGQRIKLWKEAAELVGECRVLQLALADDVNTVTDYRAPVVFDHRSGRLKWLWWQARFGYYLPSARYRSILHEIRTEFPFDAAICSYFNAAPAAPLDSVPCLLDVDALHWPHSRFTRLIWPLTKHFMRQRARRFARVLVIAKPDGDVLRSPGVDPLLLPGASTTVRECYPPDRPRGRNVLFVGPRGWPPNGASMAWMIASGLPQRLYELGYVLRFVGDGTDTFAAIPGFSGGGYVDDLAREYAEAAIVVCPIDMGHGANIKLAEAIQYGCAVLASDYSARAYEGVLEPGVHLATFANRAVFVDTLLALLRDESRLRAYRAKASEVAREKLSHDKLTTVMANLISEVLAERHTG